MTTSLLPPDHMKTGKASNKRILVVDDNDAIHQDFQKILNGSRGSRETLEQVESLILPEHKRMDSKSEEGYLLDSAHQGEEALNLVRQNFEQGTPYAMVFMDVRMPPGLDGIETTEKVWEIDPDIQVVLCTAFSDYSLDELSLRLKRIDQVVILKKPFDTEEVVQLAISLTDKWQRLKNADRQIDQLQEENILRERELRWSEERYRLIAEHATDLIAIVDKKGNFLYNSPSYQRLLGYSLDEFRSGRIFDHIHPDDCDFVRDAIKHTFVSGNCGLFEYRFQHSDGCWCALEAQASVIRQDSGDSDQLVLFARDITERKEAEQARCKMEVELRHAQKMESIGQLAAGIAHEINTPTQYIGDNANFLKEAFEDLQGLILQYRNILQTGGDVSQLQEAADQAEEEADWHFLEDEIPSSLNHAMSGVEQVSRIVNALKEFSHPGSDERTMVDLNHAIESTVTVARNEWKYVAEVQLDLDSGLSSVACYPGEFNQAILNLITNAAHAIGDVLDPNEESKGSISISTRPRDQGVEITVKDTGKGISPELRQKIFEPFFTTKEVGKGTGQGLAIVHSVIVEKHAGKVRLDSEVGKGSTFTLWIPASEPPNTSENSASTP